MLDNTFCKTIANLCNNQQVKTKLSNHQLNINQVAWEDTSRSKNSSWGTNISDLTLNVNGQRMPLIRANNFVDTTIDLAYDDLPLLVVGNESGDILRKVTLQHYLENFHDYCGTTSTNNVNLYCERDAHVLSSAQACVLPIQDNQVDFAVDVYNYRSWNTPAVLVIMATAYGTSAQVVCGGNTILHFNDNGTAKSFKAERLTQYRASQGRPLTGEMTSEEKSLNGIYIFQVPLKKEPQRYASLCSANIKQTTYGFQETKYVEEEAEESDPDMGYDLFGGDNELCYSSKMNTSSCLTSKFNAVPKSFTANRSRGMERAILKLGQDHGKFRGILDKDNKPYKLKRDTDRPIRLTVQFYVCTDENDLSDNNITEMATQIRKIYDKGLNESSLVTGDVTVQPGVKKTEPDQTSRATRPTATTTKVYSFLDNNIL